MKMACVGVRLTVLFGHGYWFWFLKFICNPVWGKLGYADGGIFNYVRFHGLRFGVTSVCK